MDKTSLYPLKFQPILKEKVWGGNKLTTQFNKNAQGLIGESWELSGVNGNVSVVSNGALKGTSLKNLLNQFKAEILGERVYNKYDAQFPILFKYIDAAQDLSVQLHPNDTLAKKRHNSFGKTEMWYIMQAEVNARIILGLKDTTTIEDVTVAMNSKNITDILTEIPVVKGESYFIAPGTIHAIGAGVVLAEIQQTSDITYRIYDWDRPGLDGKLRELHTEEAIEAINFKQNSAVLITKTVINKPILLKKTNYFVTNKLVLTMSIQRDLVQLDSFIVYMCVDGSAKIEANKSTVDIKIGETILIPHSIANIKISTNSATLLEVYIP